jgi:hypothetical protein
VLESAAVVLGLGNDRWMLCQRGPLIRLDSFIGSEGSILADVKGFFVYERGVD